MEEFIELREGYERKLHEDWEIVRWLGYNQLALSPFVKHKPKTLQEFCPFPWEKAERKEKRKMIHVTDEETAILVGIYKDFISRGGGATS